MTLAEECIESHLENRCVEGNTTTASIYPTDSATDCTTSPLPVKYRHYYYYHVCSLLLIASCQKHQLSILKKSLTVPWHYNIVLWGKTAYLSSVKRPWTETQSTLGSRYSMENSSAGTAYTLYWEEYTVNTVTGNTSILHFNINFINSLIGTVPFLLLNNMHTSI